MSNSTFFTLSLIVGFAVICWKDGEKGFSKTLEILGTATMIIFGSLALGMVIVTGGFFLWAIGAWAWGAIAK